MMAHLRISSYTMGTKVRPLCVTDLDRGYLALNFELMMLDVKVLSLG